MGIVGVPYESDVKARPVLVGYCVHGPYVYNPYSPGQECDCELPHKLRKRRMWPCVVCEHYYATRADLFNHEHEWL